MSEQTAITETPWGVADHVTLVCEGIWDVSTPSHGGIKLSRNRNRQMPDYMRMAGGWYEEDVEWCLPCIVFEADILLNSKEVLLVRHILERDHQSTFKNWFPDQYERFFGIELKPGESYKRDEKLWFEKHKDSMIVKSAFGDWYETVPKGMVGVIAGIGGRGGEGRQFLVPQEEYTKRGKFGFVVDPSKHQEFNFYKG